MELLRDWQGLLAFVRWMETNKKDIDDAAEMPGNGQRMRRRTIVAVRVFLERIWLSEGFGQSQAEERDLHLSSREIARLPLSPSQTTVASAAPPDVISEVRTIVERLEGWGGWPSNREVWDYCFVNSVSHFPPT